MGRDFWATLYSALPCPDPCNLSLVLGALKLHHGVVVWPCVDQEWKLAPAAVSGDEEGTPGTKKWYFWSGLKGYWVFPSSWFLEMAT